MLDFLLSFLVKHCHLVLLEFGGLHSLLQLCFFHFLFHEDLLWRLIEHILLYPVDLSLRQDHCIMLETLFSFAPEFPQLMYGNYTNSEGGRCIRSSVSD